MKLYNELNLVNNNNTKRLITDRTPIEYCRNRSPNTPWVSARSHPRKRVLCLVAAYLNAIDKCEQFGVVKNRKSWVLHHVSNVWSELGSRRDTSYREYEVAPIN
jgi:hypothetical protein